MQRTPAGLPFGMPGIGEEMEGAMQQAPQLGLQENFVMAPVYSKHHSKHRQPQSTRLDHVCISPLQYDPTDSFESIYSDEWILYFLHLPQLKRARNLSKQAETV